MSVPWFDQRRITPEGSRKRDVYVYVKARLPDDVTAEARYISHQLLFLSSISLLPTCLSLEKNSFASILVRCHRLRPSQPGLVGGSDVQLPAVMPLQDRRDDGDSTLPKKKKKKKRFCKIPHSSANYIFPIAD